MYKGHVPKRKCRRFLCKTKRLTFFVMQRAAKRFLEAGTNIVEGPIGPDFETYPSWLQKQPFSVKSSSS